MATQQFVVQSEFFVHFAMHASLLVESYVVHVKPSQQLRAPPHVSFAPAHWQSSASAQKPLSGIFANGMQHPVSQSDAAVHGFRHPA